MCCQFGTDYFSLVLEKSFRLLRSQTMVRWVMYVQRSAMSYPASNFVGYLLFATVSSRKLHRNMLLLSSMFI